MDANITAVTGLVLHFRTPEKTLACLRSQEREGVRKVIVVDNSEDGGQSVAAMMNELDSLRSAGLKVEVLSPGENLGFASGVNVGLAHIAAGPPSHVLLINSDAFLASGSIRQMRAALKRAEIVAPRIAQGSHPPTTSFSYYDRLLGLITYAPKLTGLRHASGCCLLIHHHQARPCLFDQDFFFYGEDVMLGFDACRHGISVSECDDAVVFHATSSSSRDGSLFYEYHINRAHWLLARKLARSRPELCAFVAARCITLPLRALVRCLRFSSLVAWKGLWAATVDVVRGQRRSFTPRA